MFLPSPACAETQHVLQNPLNGHCHTDTYISLMESPNEGSVAQLVVRQIPALKAGGSNPSWVTRFLHTKYIMVFFLPPLAV